MDNETVAKTLRGEWATATLTPYRKLANGVRSELEEAGLVVRIEEVSETNKYHRAAHRMSHAAWDQLLYKEEWRPTAEAPKAWLPSRNSSTTPDEVSLSLE